MAAPVNYHSTLKRSMTKRLGREAAFFSAKQMFSECFFFLERPQRGQRERTAFSLLVHFLTWHTFAGHAQVWAAVPCVGFTSEEYMIMASCRVEEADMKKDYLGDDCYIEESKPEQAGDISRMRDREAGRRGVQHHYSHSPQSQQRALLLKNTQRLLKDDSMTQELGQKGQVYESADQLMNGLEDHGGDDLFPMSPPPLPPFRALIFYLT
jgi:hypothetical protein